MKKIYVMVIAVAAILFVSCGSKTEKATTDACVCESCQCDPCECAEQEDSAVVEETEAEDEGLVESVNGAMDKSQTKAKAGKAKAGRGACRHAGCGCRAYQMAWDGSGGKCVCGHWDYVHN